MAIVEDHSDEEDLVEIDEELLAWLREHMPRQPKGFALFMKVELNGEDMTEVHTWHDDPDGNGAPRPSDIINVMEDILGVSFMIMPKINYNEVIDNAVAAVIEGEVAEVIPLSIENVAGESTDTDPAA